MTESEQIASWMEEIAALALPDTDFQLGEIAEVANLHVTGAGLNLELRMMIPAEGCRPQLQSEISAWCQKHGVSLAELDIDTEVLAAPAAATETGIPGVKNILAVASGKGGVGKSTTSVNLALALAAEGAKVGILDADIYGPSIPTMLGAAGQRPEVHSGKIMDPVPALGLSSNSIGYLVDENAAMAWRGPMATGALQQLLRQTRWGNLDYLVIDMPPGTGDIQLTLAQNVPVTGAVVVTTPQDIALLDARKGIELFDKVSVPVVGIVENMSTHICSQCGHEEAIFGHGGGEKLAAQFGTQLLGALPLSLAIREQADSGLPTVAADKNSDAALSYRRIARRVAAILCISNQAESLPTIEISDD